MVGNGPRKRRAAFKVLKGTTKFFISQKYFIFELAAWSFYALLVAVFFRRLSAGFPFR